VLLNKRLGSGVNWSIKFGVISLFLLLICGLTLEYPLKNSNPPYVIEKGVFFNEIANLMCRYFSSGIYAEGHLFIGVFEVECRMGFQTLDLLLCALIKSAALPMPATSMGGFCEYSIGA